MWVDFKENVHALTILKDLLFLGTTVCYKYRILMRRFFEVYLLFRIFNVCMLTNYSKMEDVKARGLIKASLLFGKLYVASGSSFFWWAAQSLLLSSQEHCLMGNIWKEKKHWWIRQKYKNKYKKTKRQKGRMTDRHFPRKSIACLKETYGRKTNNGEFGTFYCLKY